MLYRGNIFFNKTTQSVVVVLVVLVLVVCLSCSVCCSGREKSAGSFWSCMHPVSVPYPLWREVLTQRGSLFRRHNPAPPLSVVTAHCKPPATAQRTETRKDHLPRPRWSQRDTDQPLGRTARPTHSDPPTRGTWVRGPNKCIHSSSWVYAFWLGKTILTLF